VFQVRCSELGCASVVEVLVEGLVVVDAWRRVGDDRLGFLNEMCRFTMGTRRDGVVDVVSCARRGVGELV
jgi:hypothetical protein